MTKRPAPPLLEFERHHEPLLHGRAYMVRLLWHAAAAFAFIGIALALGTVGYHTFAGLPWIDALLNASMILTGMGPVDVLHGARAKLFASAYAIFSGVAFLTTVGVLLAPVAHRLLHRFHLEDEAAERRPR